MSNLAERSSFVVLILDAACVVLAALALAHTVSLITVVIALWVTVVVNRRPMGRGQGGRHEAGSSSSGGSSPQVEVSRTLDGTKEWRLNGQLHREDGPAVERADGAEEWWLHGQRHREHGPAFESPDGTKAWWLNGKLHRKDGPAFESADGSRQWWLNGLLHREDGPAVVRADGTKAWWVNGQLHRSSWRVARRDGRVTPLQYLGSPHAPRLASMA